ncbi:MAG: enoyl-CoA hydratase/isomerase family protein [Phycisphaerales bacterium]|nr:enoyl-CoA hydratase/isomerase family protein [Phycisphaerales bacterium]
MTDTALAPLAIERRADGGAIVWLDAGDRPVVVMNRTLLSRLDSTIDDLLANQPDWVVLASNAPRSFVAGADLSEINSLTDDDLDAYMVEGQRVFSRLADMTCPVVAAVGGAALGGGLELAMHCHAIVASTVGGNDKPYPIGLPEAGLGLCPAWGGTQLLAGRIDPATAVDATAQGRPFKSDAMPTGLADATVDTPDTLIEAAATHAASMQAARPANLSTVDTDALLKACSEARGLNTPAANAVTACIHAGAERDLEAGLAAERANIVALRNTEDTRQRIEAFLNRG